MAKAAAAGASFTGRAGLQKKVITERTGKQNTHWVKTGKDQPKGRDKAAPQQTAPAKPGAAGETPAKVGDHVQFTAGDFSGQGKVTSGPAPKAMTWFLVTLSKDERLLVDKAQVVEADKYLVV